MWGTAYTPSAAFDLPVDLLPVPVFNRGVVARMLMLGYNVANNTPVPVVTTPLTGPASGANRAVTLTATISGKASKVVAEVEFCDSGCVAQGILPPQSGSPPAVVVHSWQVTR